jgi:hypothetical protein
VRTHLFAALVFAACSSSPSQICVSPCQDMQAGGGNGGGGTGANGGGGSASSGGGTGARAPTDDVFVSGTRIKAARAQQGTLSLVTAWRDTQLNQDCLLYAAADGQQRCMPMSVPYAVDGYFSDMGCTQPAFPATSASALAIRYDTSSCAFKVHVFNVGAHLSTRTLFFKSGTSCGMVTVPANQEPYALGSELPASNFVAVTTTPATAGGVAFDQITFDDGAHGTYSLRDSAIGSDCFIRSFTDGTLRCGSFDYAWAGSSFANSTCTQPAALDTSCTPPKYAAAGYEAVGCEPQPKLVELVAALTGYFSGTPASCTAQTPGPNVTAYATGAAVPASRFTQGQVALVGTGRIQEQVVTWPSGVRSGYRFFDSQLNEFCTFYGKSTDTERVCSPSTPGLYVYSFYSDPGCSQPLAGASTALPSCTPKFVTSADADWVGHSFPVGARYSGAVYSGTPASCSAVTSQLSAWTFFTLGAELDRSQLATLPQSLQ